MKKLLFLSLLLSSGSPLVQANIGSLDVKKCFEDSSLGKQERVQLEQLRKQFTDNIEKLENELEVLSKQLQDEDYMEGLSVKTSEEMKLKFEELSREYSAYQAQYYQLLNQANARATQKLLKEIKEASLKVLNDQNLSLILNEEAILASKEGIDVTDKVLETLETKFSKKTN